jgi:hypothetical protein
MMPLKKPDMAFLFCNNFILQQNHFLENQTRCAIILDYGKAAPMKRYSRLAILILVNVLISAVTTLTVLWLWERAHPRPTATAPIITAVEENNTPDTYNTATPELLLEFVENDIQVSIRTVVGAGDLAVEYVEIINQSDGPVDLDSWQLINENNQTFSFPTMILNQDGAIKIYSRKGTNTVIELYWQADQPIWQPGDTVRLVDASGDAIATYSIP